MSTVVQCVKCKGSGKDYYNTSKDCNVCGGDGHVVVPDPPTKCAKCKGSGKDYYDSSKDCNACKGSGYVLG
jgi:DnaJ-class molecular chaperone